MGFNLEKQDEQPFHTESWIMDAHGKTSDVLASMTEEIMADLLMERTSFVLDVEFDPEIPEPPSPKPPLPDLLPEPQLHSGL
jgi:hypothetical protein